ncbi:MAG: TfoX/Sxy family protein [Desulfobacterales bacterium]|jgi:TfoX/Sxy family transcriptional regulator of competence genes
MPYNEEIDERIRKVVHRWKNTEAKKMFGGVCHLLNGNMVCGVYKDYLILRLGEPASAEALKQPHARHFDITGKPMKGWVMVDGTGFKTDAQLKSWLNKAKTFVKTLPPK